MSRSTVIAVVVTAFAVASAFLLNPTAEQHRAKIRATVAERSPLAGALGVGVLTAFTSTYHSLGVVSYTKVNERTTSIGALGLVYVREPEAQK